MVSEIQPRRPARRRRATEGPGLRAGADHLRHRRTRRRNGLAIELDKDDRRRASRRSARRPPHLPRGPRRGPGRPAGASSHSRLGLPPVSTSRVAALAYRWLKPGARLSRWRDTGDGCARQLAFGRHSGPPTSATPSNACKALRSPRREIINCCSEEQVLRQVLLTWRVAYRRQDGWRASSARPWPPWRERTALRAALTAALLAFDAAAATIVGSGYSWRARSASARHYPAASASRPSGRRPGDQQVLELAH